MSKRDTLHLNKLDFSHWSLVAVCQVLGVIVRLSLPSRLTLFAFEITGEREVTS